VKIPSLFRRRRSFSRKNSPARHNNGENGPPKNGWLALAVVGVFALMILLVAVNVRLLLSPAATGKRSVASDHPRSEFGYPAGANVSSTPPDKICAPSPAITFDSKRNDPDQRKSGRDDESSHPIRKGDATKEYASAQSSKSVVKNETCSEPDEAHHKKTPQTHAKRNSENDDVSSKRYTVQVGAFTNPQTAQQQARSWKSRGYDAVLRPVAMPKSGVIYRLYLGSFKSEKEADDLVKDLKTKGFTSFRLLVSN
jgi:hypothetical protein